MKKILMLFTAIIICSSVNATIRRVGFFANQIAGQDYFTFPLAYTAATNGDTILVFPGKSLSPQTGISKKLIIIGTGNWLDPNSTPKGNANLQAFAGSVSASSIQFLTGSAGSVVMGFDFNSATVYVGADNITLRRNKDLYVNLCYNTNGSASTPISVNNLQLLENYRLGITDSYNNFSNLNINISNNLIYSFNLNTNSSFNGNIANNIWVYDNTNAAGNGGSTVMSNSTGIALSGGAWLLQNNIFLSYTNASAVSNYNYFTFTGETNSVFNYNLALQSSNFLTWPTGTGNIITPIANASNIFAAFPAIGSSTADARYQLTANSPAKVANRPGSTVDAGMYAGPTPYKLSNIPSIPTVYLFTSPNGNNPSGSTIQFNVSTRGNN
jgi:hypothetical protein